MKKLNHYQKDIIFLVMLIVLQLAFATFFPFRNPDNVNNVDVDRMFLMVRFEFLDANVTMTYLPILPIVFAILLLILLLMKYRRWALIYGFAVVLVAKAYYIGELFALEGTHDSLVAEGLLVRTVLVNGDVAAQDFALPILAVLLVIKIGIYVHDTVMYNKAKKQTT